MASSAGQVNTLYSAYDYQLSAIILVGASGNLVDIRRLVQELNIYEDITGDFVTGSMVINDSLNHNMYVPLSGFEYVAVKFDKPSFNDPIQKIFRIYKVANRNLVQDKNESYTVHFCSEEALLSNQYLVSKSYKGMLISDIVTDLLQNQLKIPTSRFNTNNIDPTKGITDIILPSYRPIQAVNWLATRAISTKYPNGAFYHFFENRNGFYFKTIESLFDVPNVAQTFNYGVKNVQDASDPRVADMSQDIVNIRGFSIDNNFDVLRGISQGHYAAHMGTVDFLRQRFDDNIFNYSQFYPTVKHVEPNNTSAYMSDLKNRFGDMVSDTYHGFLRFMPTKKGQDTDATYIKSHQPGIHPDLVENWVLQHNSQKASLRWLKIRMTIPGNIQRAVGDIIQFNMPSIEYESSSSRTLDTYYSGRYLIVGLRHRITQSTYETLIEVVKDTTKTALPSSSGNPNLSTLVNM